MIDIHTHLHPERLGQAIRRWFNENSDWNLEHPFDPASVVAALKKNGVERFVFCSYAHKPGIAKSINTWLAKTSDEIGRYGLPLFTVHLDDSDYHYDAKEAITDGCIGLKIHEDVQALQIDDTRFRQVYEEVIKIGGFVLAHMGPIPWRQEPTAGVLRVQRVKKEYPELKLVLAHMGTPDTESYFELLERTPNLYLDTTMAFSKVKGLEHKINVADLEKHSGKILLGTDYPNNPYAYDCEPKTLQSIGLSDLALQAILGGNAKQLLSPFL